jgi:hypothetical protein
MAELRKVAALPPILTHAPGKGTGVKLKSDYCINNCPRATIGVGFVPDFVPEAPRIAIMLPKPEKDDATNFEAATGPLGRFLTNILLRQAGITKDEVLITHVLRCSTWNYPTGPDAGRAERSCRNFDRHTAVGGARLSNTGSSLESWGPNVFIPTFDLGKLAEVGAYYALALDDVRKAMRFAASGYRPLLLMGAEATFFLAPWLAGAGGIKNWRGHWWEGDWRFMVNEQTAAPAAGFLPVATTYNRNRFAFRRKATVVKKVKEIEQPMFKFEDEK